MAGMMDGVEVASMGLCDTVAYWITSAGHVMVRDNFIGRKAHSHRPSIQSFTI